MYIIHTYMYLLVMSDANIFDIVIGFLISNIVYIHHTYIFIYTCRYDDDDDEWEDVEEEVEDNRTCVYRKQDTPSSTTNSL